MSGIFNAALSGIASLLSPKPQDAVPQDATAGDATAGDAAAHGAAALSLISTVLASSGGIMGLMAKFQAAGLGDKVSSWIGTGANLPVSAADITKVFPPEQIEAFAAQHGVPAGVASQILARLLPATVDAATPAGTLPTDPAQPGNVN
jgi:uncharacterized protein YidB (DUF937 family)